MSKHRLITEKIMTLPAAVKTAEAWRSEGKTIVFTNGCFDILHKGHVDYLAKASELGDKLVVGLNTDNSVKRQGKSPSRPIQDESSRALILASLQSIDAVILFDEDTPYELIKAIEPDVLVKGADYKPENIVGYDVVTARGGSVKTIDFLPGYSTTLIERKIKES